MMRAPVSLWQMTCVSAPSSSTMTTVAPMTPVVAQVQRLGTQAEHDVGPRAAHGVGHLGGQRHRRAGEGHAQRAVSAGSLAGPGAPLSTSIPSIRFMPGLPRKCATNELAGRA